MRRAGQEGKGWASATLRSPWPCVSEASSTILISFIDNSPSPSCLLLGSWTCVFYFLAGLEGRGAVWCVRNGPQRSSISRSRIFTFVFAGRLENCWSRSVEFSCLEGFEDWLTVKAVWMALKSQNSSEHERYSFFSFNKYNSSFGAVFNYRKMKKESINYTFCTCYLLPIFWKRET